MENVFRGGTVIAHAQVTNKTSFNIDVEIFAKDGVLHIIVRHAEERKGSIILAQKGESQCLS